MLGNVGSVESAAVVALLVEISIGSDTDAAVVGLGMLGKLLVSGAGEPSTPNLINPHNTPLSV
jgi:hypothetical protein